MKNTESRLAIILLDQGLFTVYKRLFVVCFARNITEAFLRVVFWLAVNLLGWSWIPLFVKTATTSLLQSLGGGCGVSSIAWLIYALVLALKDKDNTSSAIIALASVILGLLCLSSFAAFPLVRHLHHNIFERTHRFAGWMAPGLLWASINLTRSYFSNSNTYTRDLKSRLAKQKEFWFTIAITMLIIIPWLTVRRAPVKVSAPSGHALIIKFKGGVKAGILDRISPSPFSEWHAFGFISDGKEEHMMLAGAVGDFTKSLVTNPPSHLWVSASAFLRIALSSEHAQESFVGGYRVRNLRVPLVSVTAEFGEDKVIVHDTALLGRPNVSQMSVEAARAWGAEVVIVTSNPQGSRDVVNACTAAGIAAFGPIWDS
ncbi:hypothetical protein L484_006157 [Morus notabilis]|uniref:Uncharacterized protein n=1 Tax=Morus notabilis TaxID=981085 RepID=W9RZP6_9ROSA|nr:hypothetical protein L484_006157 [Morus notabilis]